MIVGKLHEISFYGLLTAIVLCIAGLTTPEQLWACAFSVSNFQTFFFCYLAWAAILFIPIAIIGAFATKYRDGGMGLSFASNNIFIIIMAHIGEEILGLICTPFWFLMHLFTKQMYGERIFDYISWAILIAFIVAGILTLV